MTAVLFKFQHPDGTPVVDAPFVVTLRKPTFDETYDTGILVPGDIPGLTDAQGECTLNLAHGYGTYYLSMVLPGDESPPDGCMPGLRYKFVVPESAGVVRVEDLIVTSPTWSRPWDEQALALISEAKVASQEAAIEAKAASKTAVEAADRAETVVAGVHDDAEAAAASANAAHASEQAAASSAGTAGTAASAAQQSAQGAANSASLAAESKTQAGLSESEAKASAAAAAGSAASAVGSASTATSAAGGATAARDRAETAANTATTKAGEAATSATTATTQADRSKTEADKSKVSADAAAAAMANKQDKNANLTAFSGLVGAADRLPYFTGAGALSLAAITSKARTILALNANSEIQSEIGLVPVTSNTDQTLGRLLTPGYAGWGLNDPVRMPEGTSARNLPVVNGLFLLAGNTNTDLPNGEQNCFIIQMCSPNFVRQVAYKMGETASWERSGQLNVEPKVWTDWSVIAGSATNKAVTNANLVPVGQTWTVSGLDSQAAANNWPVINGGQGSPVWWNITSTGVSARITQIARQAYNNAPSATYVRSLHDTTWSTWFKIPTSADIADRTSTTAGQILAVGHAGWNGGIAIIKGGTVDCNTLTTSGLFALNESYINGPPSMAGAPMYLKVFVHTSGWEYQEAYGITNTGHSCRRRVGNVWGEWTNIFDGINSVLDPSSGGLMSAIVVSGWVIEKFLNGTCILTGTSITAQLVANAAQQHTVALPAILLNEANAAPLVNAIPRASSDISMNYAYVTGGANPTSLVCQIKNGATAQITDLRIKIIGRWR